MEGIAGFERVLFYNDGDDEALVRKHQEVIKPQKSCDPYFNFTNKGTPLMFRLTLAPGIALKIGEIGAFSGEQIARILNEQMIEYILSKTMGRNYPKDDKEMNMALALRMIGGFTPERVVVLVEMDNGGGRAPIAGVQAYLGYKELTLRDGLLDRSGELSSLASFSAVYPKDDVRSIDYLHFLKREGGLEESKAVTMSRLFRRSNALLAVMEGRMKGLAGLCMASLAMGVVQFELERRRDLSRLFIYDTHLLGLRKMLREAFGMEEVLSTGEVKATAAISESVLKYHYSESESGGYLDEIVVGQAEMGVYVLAAIDYLDKNWGIELINLKKGGDDEVGPRVK